MEDDLLTKCGVPEYVRWYANKCFENNVAYSQYFGWKIFTVPAVIDGTKLIPGEKVFSSSEIYIRKLNNISEVASESRIYLNCAVDQRYADIKISAPYVSLRNFSAQELSKVSAEHYVLYYGVPDITNYTGEKFKLTYISDLQLKYAIPGCEIYGSPQLTLRKGDEYDASPSGHNGYHMIALGALKPEEVEALCRGDDTFTQKNAIKKCLLHPPIPKLWTYRSDLPKLSYSDMLFLLRNKNAADICETIRKPFMHYYPEIDYSSNPDFCELVSSTKAGINAFKVEGYPNCA